MKPRCFAWQFGTKQRQVGKRHTQLSLELPSLVLVARSADCWPLTGKRGSNPKVTFADELDTICGQANPAPIERPAQHNSAPHALCPLPAFLHCGFGLMLQKNSEPESVRYQ